MTALGFDEWDHVFSYLLEPDYLLPLRGVFIVRLVCRLFRDVVRLRYKFAQLLDRVPPLQWSRQEAELAVDAVQAFRFLLSYGPAHPADPFLSAPGNRVLALRSRSSTMVVMDEWTSETSFSDERLTVQLADGRVCIGRALAATDGLSGQDDTCQWSNLPHDATQLATEAIGIHMPGLAVGGEQPPNEAQLQFLKSFADEFLHGCNLSATREADVVYVSVLASLARHKAAGGGRILSTYYIETPCDVGTIYEDVQHMAEARSRIMLDSFVVLQIGVFFSTGPARLGERENRIDVTVHGLPFTPGFVKLLEDERAMAYVRLHFFPAAAATKKDLVCAMVNLDPNLRRVWDMQWPIMDPFDHPEGVPQE